MQVQNLVSGNFCYSGSYSVSVSKDTGDLFSGIFDAMSIQNNAVSESQNVNTVNLKNNTVTKENADSPVTKDVKTDAAVNSKTEAKAETSKNTESTDLKNVESEENEISTEDIEKVQSLLTEIANVFEEFLGISKDELKNFLDENGISLENLTDSDTLRNLFVNVNCDGDIGTLLTDENALKLCESFLGEMTEVLSGEDVDLLNTEVVNSVLHSFNMSDPVKDTEEFDSESSVNPKDLRKVTENTEVKEGNAQTKDTETISFEYKNSKDEGDNTETEKRNDENTFDTDVSLSEKFVNTFTAKFEEKISGITDTAAATDIRMITDQILEQIKINITPDTTHLEISLTPEHLGKVNVQIESTDNTVTAKFTAETRVAKEAIESNLIQFKEQLVEQGIKVDTIEVTVSDFAFNKNGSSGQNEENGKANKNKRELTLDEINEKLGDNDLTAQSYIDNGTSTVNYVA